jgi:hypothetical protein
MLGKFIITVVIGALFHVSVDFYAALVILGLLIVIIGEDNE